MLQPQENAYLTFKYPLKMAIFPFHAGTLAAFSKAVREVSFAVCEPTSAKKQLDVSATFSP
jgi:hypothetical protein